MSSSKRVLIVDQLNLFFRNYIVNPSISTDGAPIGGLRGCIQSLQKVIRESKTRHGCHLLGRCGWF